MAVAGLDLSLSNTGLVILRHDTPYYSDLIKTKPTKNNTDEVRRLQKIRDTIIAQLKEQQVVLALIEGMSYLSRNTNSITQLAGLNYMVRESLIENNIPFIIVAPTTLKKFVTGKGNVGKDVMMLETYKRYHVSILDDNLVDAHGLGRIGMAILNKDPNFIKCTKPQQEVIELLSKQLP